METQLVITITHPDDVSANAFVSDAITPYINDINADSDPAWSLTVSSVNPENKLRERALRTALAVTLSEFPVEWSTDAILDAIHDDHELVVVWETFENWDKDELIEHIQQTANVIYDTYF